uniref:Uncharacterized protein n=1 Tax=Ananas comosus var. bracteatus TaxID=296719 RepID=A0A6V7PQJ7_ANACO|nr:unnamed protein product [Ananas comosus var. bracteatus]
MKREEMTYLATIHEVDEEGLKEGSLLTEIEEVLKDFRAREPVPLWTNQSRSSLCEHRLSASLYAYGDRSLPAKDRSPRAELSGLSQIFDALADCAYGDRSLPPGIDP